MAEKKLRLSCFSKFFICMTRHLVACFSVSRLTSCVTVQNRMVTRLLKTFLHTQPQYYATVVVKVKYKVFPILVAKKQKS